MINKLSEINLNLLNVLDVLLSERNTTEAAKKLHLTQPSISYSLKQLRVIFDDELLIRNNFNSTMYMTPLAKSLVYFVRSAVLNLESVFKIKDFDPNSSRRIIRIAISDYALSALMPYLIRKVNKQAPHVAFRISGINYSTVREQLNNQEIDIAIGAFNHETEKSLFVYDYLFSEEVGCWADINHPAFQSEVLTMDDYMKYPHLVIRHPKSCSRSTIEGGTFKDIIDSGHTGNISIHNSTECFGLLLGTNYICLAAKKINCQTKSFNLAYRTPPFKIPELRISLCRGIDKDNDQAILWIISQIKAIASLL